MKSLKKDHKLAMLCLKYIPVIMFILMWLYMVFAVVGAELVIADTIVGCSILPSILILALSEVFQFCWLHKSLTAYSLVSDILINVNRHIGLGSLALPLKTVLAVIGMILLIAIIVKSRINNLKNRRN